MSQHRHFDSRGGSHSDVQHQLDGERSGLSPQESFSRGLYGWDGSYQQHPSEGLPSSSQHPYDAFSARNAPSHIREAYNQAVQARTHYQEVTQDNMVEKYKEIRQTYLLEKDDIKDEIHNILSTLQKEHQKLHAQSTKITETINTFEWDPMNTDYHELERLETQLNKQISSYHKKFKNELKSQHRLLQEKQDIFINMDENFIKVMELRRNNKQSFDQRFYEASYSQRELNSNQRGVRYMREQITNAHDKARDIFDHHERNLKRWDATAANWDTMLHPQKRSQQELPPPPAYSSNESTQQRPNVRRHLPIPALPFSYDKR
jgi:hypothetical protein